IEELESQTGQLLSFQRVGQPVFDAQVAFNLLHAYGAASAHNLEAVCERVRAEVKACLGNSAVVPSIQAIHAPVFYGAVFSAYADLNPGADAGEIAKACAGAGFALTARGEAGPSNVSVAGEKTIQLAQPKADLVHAGTWWFWGAADNLRLPAWNAVKLAEILAGIKVAIDSALPSPLATRHSPLSSSCRSFARCLAAAGIMSRAEVTRCRKPFM